MYKEYTYTIIRCMIPDVELQLLRFDD